MLSKILVGLLIIPLLLAGCAGEKQTSATTKAKSQTTTSAPMAATTTQAASTKPASTVPALPQGVTYITPEELYPAYEVGEATSQWTYTSVDVREVKAFNTVYIFNSINIPPDTYNTDAGKQSILAGLKTLPTDQMIVFYDQSEEVAAAIAGQLLSLHLGQDAANIRVLKGGIDAWIAAGYTTRSLLHN